MTARFVALALTLWTAAVPSLLARQAASTAAPPQTTARPNVIAPVREAIARGDFVGGEQLIERHRAEHGLTPDALEALSWLGRGALAADDLDRADGYAKQTQRLSEAELDRRPLDAERHLPIALGAAFEVQAHVLAKRGRRSEAVYLLTRALETYGTTSIRTRLQKNVHLLSLEGKPAPVLTADEFLGPKPVSLADLKGRPVLMFFWAHWCPDCKMQAPVLAKLQETYGNRGLVILAPTQRYGFVKRGAAASPAEEGAHIEQVRQASYAEVRDMAVTISQEDFASYGASTTPTNVLIDGDGIVRLYHPGQMTLEQLEPHVSKLFENASN